jgi:hypothetical protein
MNKADRKRRLTRDRMRRLRVRTAETAREEQALADVQEWIERPSPPMPIPQKHVCIVCLEEAHSDICAKWYCGPHGANACAGTAPPSESAADLPTALTSLPVTTRPEPILFDPRTDPFRPAFWNAMDPNPAPIEIRLNPRTVRRTPPISGDGCHTVRVAHDPGIAYSQESGHVDIAARIAEMEEQKRKDGQWNR